MSTPALVEIPAEEVESWPLVTLRDATDFILDGTHGSPERTDSGVPVLSAQNVNDGTLSFSSTRFTSMAELDAFRRRLDIRNGDVALTIVGSIGRAAVVKKVEPAVFQRSVAFLRPKAGRTDSRYLYWIFSSLSVKDQLRKATNTSTQAGLYLGRLKDVKIPLPSIEEQRQIAAILDKADEIRRKRLQSLAYLDQLPKSIFLTMFGDPTNPEPGMNVSSVGALSNVIVPTRDKPTHFGGEIPWVTLPDLESMFKVRNRLGVSADSPNVLSNRLIPQHSILLSCAGTVGRVAVTMEPVHANQQFYGIVPNTDLVDTTYMAYSLLLRGERYYVQLGGSFTISFFSKEKAKSIPVPVPPLESQRQFAQRVAVLERIRDKALGHLSELDALCTSLQHRAFKGELR